MRCEFQEAEGVLEVVLVALGKFEMARAVPTPLKDVFSHSYERHKLATFQLEMRLRLWVEVFATVEVKTANGQNIIL